MFEAKELVLWRVIHPCSGMPLSFPLFSIIELMCIVTNHNCMFSWYLS